MPVLKALRRILVAIRDRWDAHRHPARHASARRRLGARRADRIVFVCLGNVCRSPYAARVAMARATGNDLAIDSAGFIGPDRRPPDAALRVAKNRGIDHADHRSKLLTAELAEEADALFIFDRYNVARLRTSFPAHADRMFWLGDLDPEWSGKRAIIDPWGKDDAEFDATFARIERCVEVMLQVVAAPEHSESQH